MTWLHFEPIPSRSRDARGPVGNERRADSAFMNPMFVFAERCVADIGPVFSVGDISICRTGHDSFTACEPIDHRAFASAARFAAEDHPGRKVLNPPGPLAIGLRPTHRFGATTVVLQKKNQRVVELIFFSKLLDDPADALVHAIDHRGIDFHATGFPGFVFHSSTNHRLPARAPHFRSIRPSFCVRSKRARANRFITAIIFACDIWRCPFPARASANAPRYRRHKRKTVYPDSFCMLFQKADGVIGDRIGIIKLLSG